MLWAHTFLLLLHLKYSTSWPTSLCTADITKLHSRKLNRKDRFVRHISAYAICKEAKIFKNVLPLTVPEDGKHSLWNMCLQWNTTTPKDLAMSETQTHTWVGIKELHYDIKRKKNFTENLPEGNIVAWQDSQMFSSGKKTKQATVFTISLILFEKVLFSSAFARSLENVHPPSTLTPLICVRCIFCSSERESATRIFLHPSLNRIWGINQHKQFGT